MKKSTKSIFKYILEFLIVAFGVFLGIYTSDLQNEKKIKREKEKSINYILIELENNKSNLEESIEYHQLIKSNMDSLASTLTEKDMFANYMRNKKFQHNQIKGWNGVRLADIENTAFESVKISGIIQEYDIELIQIISKIYKRQEAYSEFGKSLLDRILSLNSSTKVFDVFGSVKLMTTDLLSIEKQLLTALEKVQKDIKMAHSYTTK
ncbi:hypothetical protein [Aquimarina sp. 2304DJ70-9]|uniref:hypothetical protein n=1 Tax=Aquimarina penaris TaxID=3231044 RepID=UPI003462C221